MAATKILSATDVVDNLTTETVDVPLSANQGDVINNELITHTATIEALQVAVNAMPFPTYVTMTSLSAGAAIVIDNFIFANSTANALSVKNNSSTSSMATQWTGTVWVGDVDSPIKYTGTIAATEIAYLTNTGSQVTGLRLSNDGDYIDLKIRAVTENTGAVYWTGSLTRLDSSGQIEIKGSWVIQ